MVKTSKLFHASVAFLVFLILGLVAAIYYQRRTINESQLMERLQLDGRRMDVISDKARMVTPHIPILKEKSADLQARYDQLRDRLYDPKQRPALESFLNQITRTSQLDLSGIEDVSIDEKPAFREHVLNVRMYGPMTNLPVWANKFFQQKTLARIDRISVISPDYKFQRVRLKATIRYFEPQDLSKIMPDGIDLERFNIDLSYISDSEDKADSEYGKAIADAKEKASALATLRQELAGAQNLENQIYGLDKLVSDTGALIQGVETNRTTVLENLPTLYIRARNSPLGSAALLVQGGEARFPEVTGDD